MFDGVLRELLRNVPGARGAVFCDDEGESISTVGTSQLADHERLNDYDLRIVGASFATPIVLALEKKNPAMGVPQECVLYGKKEKLMIHVLPEHYYVVLCLAPDAVTGRARAHLRIAADLIAAELLS